MEIKPRTASVMFTGGVDSTLAAALLLEEYDQVYLVTYDYGAELFMKNCEKSLNQLIEAYGKEKIHHEYIKVEKWWRDIQIRNASQFNLVCMSCKFIMHTRTVCYCLENGIFASSDGSIHEQSQHPEQMGEVLKIMKNYYKSYFIDFTTPAYTYTKSAEDTKLASIGINMGKRFSIGEAKGSHIHRQPMCLFAFFDVLFSDNPFFPHKEEKVVEMLGNNLDYGHNLIKEYFRQKELDIQEIVREREKAYGMLRND